MGQIFIGYDGPSNKQPKSFLPVINGKGMRERCVDSMRNRKILEFFLQIVFDHLNICLDPCRFIHVCHHRFSLLYEVRAILLQGLYFQPRPQEWHEMRFFPLTYSTIPNWTPLHLSGQVVGFCVMPSTAADQFSSDHEGRGSGSRIR